MPVVVGGTESTSVRQGMQSEEKAKAAIDVRKTKKVASEGWGQVNMSTLDQAENGIERASDINISMQ